MNRSQFRKLIKECICELLNEGNFDHMVKSDNEGRHPKYKHLVYYELEPHHGSYILTAPATPENYGDLLISDEDVDHMFGEDAEYAKQNGFAYGPDDYLEMMEKENLRESNDSQLKDLIKKYRKIVDAAGNARVSGDRESLNRLLAAQEVIERKLDSLVSENVMYFIKEDNDKFDKHGLAREVGKYLTKKLGTSHKNWPTFDDFQTILSSPRALKLLSKYPLEKAGEVASEMILAVSGNHLKEEKMKRLREVILEYEI